MQNRLDSYRESFQQITELPASKLFPSMELFKNHPSKENAENFAQALIEMGNAYSHWINQFVAITKGFKTLVVRNPEFIDRLGKSNPFLQEFVIQTGNLYKINKVVLNEGFFLFAKIHNNKLKKIIQEKAIREAVIEGQAQLESFMEDIVPAMEKVDFSRKTAIRYIIVIKGMNKANKKISVTKELQNNLDDYILPELKPLMTFLDE